MIRRDISHLFDRVFKCLLSFSDTAVISLINGLFHTSYPPSSPVSHPSVETIEHSMRRSLADMVVTVNGDSYLIEAQIRNDIHMGVRIFQYIMNEGRKGGEGDHYIRIRLPRACVIYWEATAGTPEKETIEFIFPGGEEYRYEVGSVKFSEYTVEDLEREGLWVLLPFCVMGLRREAARAKGSEERRKLAKKLGKVMEAAVEGMIRGVDRGWLKEGDMKNSMAYMKILREEVYKPYTEFEEEEIMWEHIKVVDYEKLEREREEAICRADEVARHAEEVSRRAEELSREREAAVRKLLELGVSREQLVKEGILK
ncbi:MAG: hypothetical protein LBB77_02000 [Treponema sp.]|jgi:hypothetical protein|nr:hypothetical protein [Treponema sp.]